MKKFVMMVIAMSFITSSAMAAGGKIAYVDTQKVFDKTKLGKKYQEIVREYYESRKKILDMDANEIQSLQEEYNKQKQAKMLNEKAQKEKEEIISRKVAEFEKKRNMFSEEIARKNEELSIEFNRQMVAVLTEVAKREKVSLVINKTINIMSKAEVPSVLYGDESLDLTEELIAEIDKADTKK